MICKLQGNFFTLTSNPQIDRLDETPSTQNQNLEISTKTLGSQVKSDQKPNGFLNTDPNFKFVQINPIIDVVIFSRKTGQTTFLLRLMPEANWIILK